MRAGACTVQQTLTSEAASVLKHSLTLARRRGHAQITPLHVAATLLSSRVSLLRRACLKSQPHSSSHPLQCRALELCFNVALNRLPTSPSPLLHGQPSLSNALIAALKRAQAHQRRGCIEQQQQQPLLAIKVELEQLIISILDDPSVSRVMREAGFSSTNVKNNLEDSSPSSVFQYYNTATPTSDLPHQTFWQTHFFNSSSEQNPVFFSHSKKPLFSDSDLKLVFEVLTRKKKRNVVIVGDSVSATEGLVSELMGRVERGEVPEDLKSSHFIKFQFPTVSLRFMKREDVEMKIADLRRKVGSLSGGAIIYAGDLKWAVELEAHENGGILPYNYNPVDHLVAEIGRLMFDYSSKIWLVATANYQSYMRCQMKQPSLEIRWALQAVSVPCSGGLGLSLHHHASSGIDTRMSLSQNPTQMVETKPLIPKEEQDKLSCCAECTSNFEKDATFLKSGQQKPSSLSNFCTKDMDQGGSTHLPYWLQPQRPESNHKDDLAELRRKWNRLCHSLHHSRHNQIRSSPPLFKSQNSASPYSWWPIQNNTCQDSNSIPFRDSTVKVSRSIDFGISNGTPKQSLQELGLGSLKRSESKDGKITLALGTCLVPKEETDELHKLLKENVPWQCEAIPAITEALGSKSSRKNGVWLLIQGDDWSGKRRLARAIAESFGGCPDHLVHMNMRRENQHSLCCQTVVEAIRNRGNCVVLIEDIDLADAQFLKFLSEGEREVSFSEAVFIVTTGATEERREMSYGELPSIVIPMKLQVEDSIVLGHKRKPEWELSSKSKSPKKNDNGEDENSVSSNGRSEKVFSRQSSSSTLDLNIQAEEEENEKDESGELVLNEQIVLKGFLDSIKNRFVFSRNAAQLGMLAKLKEAFEEICGGEMRGCLVVDEMVLEEIVNRSGCFLASLFEKWLKAVFQTSLQTVKKGGKEGTIRLSLGGKEESGLEVGFMGSNLPMVIQVDSKE